MFSHSEDPFSICTVTLGHCLLFESKNKHMQVALKQWTIFSIAINICIAPWSKRLLLSEMFAECCCNDYFILPKMVSSSYKEEQKKAATKLLELPVSFLPDHIRKILHQLRNGEDRAMTCVFLSFLKMGKAWLLQQQQNKQLWHRCLYPRCTSEGRKAVSPTCWTSQPHNNLYFAVLLRVRLR